MEYCNIYSLYDLLYKSIVNTIWCHRQHIYKPLILYLFFVHLATVVMSISDAFNTRYNFIIQSMHTINCGCILLSMMHCMYVINTAYCRYYLGVIWHMWNARSNTVNQHTFTSSDPDDNTWLERGIYVSSADELYNHLYRMDR